MNNKPKILLLLFLSIIIPYHSSKDNFLRIDPKNDCQNPKLSSFGVLISLSQNQETLLQSKLSQEDREAYEEMIKLKRSFSSTTSYIPQNFTPEKSNYWEKLDFLVFVFVIIAILPFLIISFYLLLRFGCKKCRGPKKLKQVSKVYRNLTWFIMIACTIVTLVLFSIILGKSESVRINAIDSFTFERENYINLSDAMNTTRYAINYFNDSNPKYPFPNIDFVNDFESNIDKSLNETSTRSAQIVDKENERANINIVIYAIYFFMVILAYIAFFIKKENFELIISIILFFAIPGFIILEGYNARFFFYYSDICDSVNSAIYLNEFPVSGQALGFYYNCFPINVKASWYNIKYRLYENIDNQNELQKLYDKVMESKISNIFECSIVNEFLPSIEEKFCKNSLNNMYSIVTLMTWALLVAIGISIGARRLQVLIWKKKMEIEEMIENKEAIF